MNRLFLLESIISGVIAGLISSLFAENIDSWNILNNFRTALFVETAFCGFFAGLITSLPFLLAEKNGKKFFNRFITGVSFGALMGTVGTVLFKLSVDLSGTAENFRGDVSNFFRWIIPALSLSFAIGFLSGGLKCIIKSLMAFTPSFVIVGYVVNRISVTNSNKEFVFVLIGLSVGTAFGLIWDYLKSSWLDEDLNHGLVNRYYLDAESFWIGTSIDCDLTTREGTKLIMQINEKDEVHILEAEDNSEVSVNSVHIKYRVLQEGDRINAAERTVIYHTNMSRIRDTVPGEIAGI